MLVRYHCCKCWATLATFFSCVVYSLEPLICEGPVVQEVLAWSSILEEDVIARLLIIDRNKRNFELLHELRHQKTQVTDFVLN